MYSLTKKTWALALILISSSANAASGPDFNQTCDDVLALENGIQQAGQNAWTVAQQKLTYCQAARDSKKAASSNGLLWKVWAGVAGVCTTACVASFFTAGMSQWVCTGSNIGAGVTDAVVTKDFASGLTAIGTSLGGKLIGKAFGGGAAKGAENAGKGGADWAACLSAAVATTTVFKKKGASSQATEAMNGNLAQAASLGAVTSVTGPTQTQLAGGGNTVTTTNTINDNRVSGGRGLTDDSGEKRVQTNCDGAADSGDTKKITSCAMMADNKLPAFVAGGPFNEELKKNTGEALGGFVRGSGNNANNAIGAASGLSGNAAGKLGELLAATEKAVGAGPVPEETMYAGGGGAPAAGGGEEPQAPDFAAAMAKLMGKGDKDEKGDPQNVKFSGKPGLPSWLRGPASEDDRNVSLFDRVTYRYYFVGRRIIFDEEPTPGAKN